MKNALSYLKSCIFYFSCIRVLGHLSCLRILFSIQRAAFFMLKSLIFHIKEACISANEAGVSNDTAVCNDAGVCTIVCSDIGM